MGNLRKFEILKQICWYGNTGCGFFKQGYKIRNMFAYPKKIIEFSVLDSWQAVKIVLVNKVISKIEFIKKCQ